MVSVPSDNDNLYESFVNAKKSADVGAEMSVISEKVIDEIENREYQHTPIMP